MHFSYDPRPRQPSRLAFHPSRIVVDAGILLLLGSMSLPFVTAEPFRQRAVAGDALPVLLLLVPVFLMTVIPDQSTPLPAPLAWASLALAAAALPYAVLKYSDASTLAGTLQGSVGIGARLMVMGVLIVLAGLVLGLVRTRFRGAASQASPAEPALTAFAPSGPPDTGGPGRTAASSDPARAAYRRERVPLPRPTASPSAPDPAAPPARAFPRWKRPATARTAAPGSPAAPARAPSRSSPRVPPRPRPADPDTEPTVPASRPVQPWWPDDLEDLFS